MAHSFPEYMHSYLFQCLEGSQAGRVENNRNLYKRKGRRVIRLSDNTDCNTLEKFPFPLKR